MRRLLLLGVLAAVACARAQTEPPPPRSAHAPRLYEVDALVLESRPHGPMLCVGPIHPSLPPQCGDVRITNWEWSEVEGEERRGGTTWGEFHVVGRYDGQRFTVRDVGPPSGRRPASPPSEISTPCAEPPGGWTAPDPDRTSERDQNAAAAWARRQPEYAGDWVQTTSGTGVWVTDETTVVTVAFTGDVERHEARLRQLWGGPLCVVEHERSYDELLRVQRALTDEPFGLQVLVSSIDVVRNRVDLEVVAADERVERSLAERYGEGVVKVYPALTPVS